PAGAIPDIAYPRVGDLIAIPSARTFAFEVDPPPGEHRPNAWIVQEGVDDVLRAEKRRKRIWIRAPALVPMLLVEETDAELTPLNLVRRAGSRRRDVVSDDQIDPPYLLPIAIEGDERVVGRRLVDDHLNEARLG